MKIFVQGFRRGFFLRQRKEDVGCDPFRKRLDRTCSTCGGRRFVSDFVSGKSRSRACPDCNPIPKETP